MQLKKFSRNVKGQKDYINDADGEAMIVCPFQKDEDECDSRANFVL